MRKVLSLSLPLTTTKKIKSLSKARGYKSVSGYIKHLVELDEELISEKEILQSIKQSRAEYKKGTTVVAESMADLL